MIIGDSWWKFGGGEDEYLQCRSHSCFVDSSVTIWNCRHIVFPCSKANFKSSYNSDDTDSVVVFHTGKSWKKFRNCSGRRRGTEHLGFPLLGVIMMMIITMAMLVMMMMMICFNMKLWHKQKITNVFSDDVMKDSLKAKLSSLNISETAVEFLTK